MIEAPGMIPALLRGPEILWQPINIIFILALEKTNTKLLVYGKIIIVVLVSFSAKEYDYGISYRA